MSAWILAASTLLQLVAALMALRLISITQHRIAWISVAAAILLMSFRRAITLYRIASGDLTLPVDLAAESVALLISVLMVVGMALIAPLFLELKQSAAKIENSRRQLQAILDHSVTAVYVKDLEGRYLLANNQVSRVLGRPLEAIVGQTDPDIFPTEIANELQKSDREVVAGGKNVELDETIPHSDGTLHHYLSVKFPLLDTAGRCYGICGISTDITDRTRQAEEHRQFDAKLQAAQKLESLGVLAGGIAHDFNNLLVAILGSADLALSHPQLNSDIKADLDHIQSAAEAAASLCKQLLAYSGRGQLQVVAVNVSELVEKMARLLEVSTSKKARLECSLAQDLPLIEADATQVMQVVMNLLTNASDAIGEQPGTITVRTSLETVGEQGVQDQIGADDLPAGKYVMIEVADTGCGMSAETTKRLFEPFYTTKFTGRGLGLSAVAGIMRGHRGAITLQSRPGEGTQFRVYFPVPLVGPSLAKATVQRPERSQQHSTVLIVDDEALVREFARRALERAGFDVCLAKDGRAAVELFKERHREISLVLLDLTMPEMDGEQTLRALKQIDPDIPVVLASGYDELSATRQTLSDSINGFLQKPYTAKQLTDCAHAALS